jgi:ribosomal protein S18 acetylase RimI-like enzyme
MQAFTVQRATEDDIEKLVLLMRDFHAEAQYPLDATWAAGAFSSLLSNPTLGCVWLMLRERQAAGFVVLSLRYTMEHAGLSGYIDDLYVRPEFRRMGAASSALDSLLAECRARGCQSIQVEVGESNPAAFALYARYGLEPAKDGRLLLSSTLSRTDL